MICCPSLNSRGKNPINYLLTIVEYIHLQQLHFEISKYSLFAFACKYREREKEIIIPKISNPKISIRSFKNGESLFFLLYIDSYFRHSTSFNYSGSFIPPWNCELIVGERGMLSWTPPPLPLPSSALNFMAECRKRSRGIAIILDGTAAWKR